MKNKINQGWREEAQQLRELAVFQRAWISLPAPHGGSQLPVTAVLGDPMTSSCLQGHKAQTYSTQADRQTDNTHIHTPSQNETPQAFLFLKGNLITVEPDTATEARVTTGTLASSVAGSAVLSFPPGGTEPVSPKMRVKNKNHRSKK